MSSKELVYKKIDTTRTDVRTWGLSEQAITARISSATVILPARKAGGFDGTFYIEFAGATMKDVYEAAAEQIKTRASQTALQTMTETALNELNTKGFWIIDAEEFLNRERKTVDAWTSIKRKINGIEDPAEKAKEIDKLAALIKELQEKGQSE